jgi:hypothetical protein
MMMKSIVLAKVGEQRAGWRGPLGSIGTPIGCTRRSLGAFLSWIEAGLAARRLITYILLLLGLTFCGCSRKDGGGSAATLELVQAGQDTTWANRDVLTVTKREGNSLEGIRLIRTGLNGQQITILADKGEVAMGDDKQSVKLILHDAQTLNGARTMHANLLTVVLTKKE